MVSMMCIKKQSRPPGKTFGHISPFFLIALNALNDSIHLVFRSNLLMYDTFFLSYLSFWAKHSKFQMITLANTFFSAQSF